jgi:DNA polymerase-3 subunit gamma/tau
MPTNQPYQVLSLKWRPQVFEDVIGQEHVTRTLQNAIKQGRIGHSYIFAGPRGVGKTTTARILAKTVNCENPKSQNPCNQCRNCIEITSGRSLDVLEIDGASNRGIDEIRNLREMVRYPPTAANYKIYIIDEFHQITREGFNALLKTLEEPPPHVIFLFATTDPQKVLATILSRCQRFDFKAIPIRLIIERLEYICKEEDVTIDADSLLLIAKKADGSLRDSQSILDQIVAYAGKTISCDDVMFLLGVIPDELYFQLDEILRDKKSSDLFSFIENFIMEGIDPSNFMSSYNHHLRDLLLMKETGDIKLLQVTESVAKKYVEEAKGWNRRDLLRLMNIGMEAQAQFSRSGTPRLLLESALLKMVQMDRSVEIDELLSALSEGKIQKKIKSGVQPVQENIVESTESVRHTYKQESLGLASSSTGNSSQIVKESVSGENSSGKSSNSSNKEELTPPLLMDSINSSWKQLVERVKKTQISLGQFLERAEPLGLKKNVFELGFSEEDDFIMNGVSKRKQIVEKHLSEILGREIRIRIKKSQLVVKKSQADNEEVKNPVVKKLVEVFDGVIIP